jgi:hypothetical protein
MCPQGFDVTCTARVKTVGDMSRNAAVFIKIAKQPMYVVTDMHVAKLESFDIGISPISPRPLAGG